MRSIDGPSTSKISITRISTLSSIVVSLPADTQLSNPPLGGMYRIKCQLPDGTWNQTYEMFTNVSWTTTIRDKIIQACPQYRDKIEVMDGPSQGYYQDTRDFLVRFVGVNADIPQLELISSDTLPLTGVDLKTDFTTFIAYNPQVLFYEPIPFEFIYTAET
jgi:hypothetical protein